MYDLRAKMDVFLRCNAIKINKGRTIPCISLEAEFRNYYLSVNYRQKICRIVPTIINYYKIVYAKHSAANHSYSSIY